MDDFGLARERMVAEQLVRRGIHDTRVLEAMRQVPRHLFVPADQQALAYADRALPIGHGQTISQPYMVAAMTQALALTGPERVLEIGTGSGYQAAILAELAREVITIERWPELASSAEAVLEQCGYSNIRVLRGDGSMGALEGAPYDGVIITAAAPQLPAQLKEQLAPRGRLVVPIGTRDHQVLTVVTREGESFRASRGEACVFVPLVGREGWDA
jgi:protein-L-isoaspartate(D-aspartate) O-methyltransferase